MTLTIKVNLDNAAFEDRYEIGRIMRELALSLDSLADQGPMDKLSPFDRNISLRDFNGNRVGIAIIR